MPQYQIACREMQGMLEKLHYEWMITQPLERPLTWAMFYFWFQ